MNAEITFPCDPRFAALVRDAVVTAVRGAGLDEARAARAAASLEQFLRQWVHQAQPTTIAAHVTDTQIRVTAVGHTFTVDL